MGVEEFKDLLLCCGNIYLWKLDSGGNLLQSNCPDEAVLGTAFELLDCKQRIVDYGSSHSRPISLRTVPGLVWYAAFERENGALKFIYAVGPVFYNDISAAAIESGIREISKDKISAEWNTHFRNAIRHIPLMQCTVMMLLVLMLHYCITGERLQISDIDAEINISIPEISQKQPSHDRYQVWSAEQALLQAVRNGDLDYKQALSDVMRLSTGVNVNGKPLWQRVRFPLLCSYPSSAARRWREGCHRKRPMVWVTAIFRWWNRSKTPPILSPLPCPCMMILYAESITTGPTQSIAEKSRSAVTISKCIWVKSLQRRCWRSGRDMPCTI